MSGRISDYQVERWLTTMQTSFLALHFDNPDVAGAYASEVFGGGYTRQRINFSLPANRAMWNLSAVSFTGLPGVTVTHLTLWDSLTAGNYLTTLALPASMRVLAGKSVAWGAQQIAVSID